MNDVDDILVELAARPPEVWRRSLRARIGDEAVAHHALIWLHANREVVLEHRRPDLGDRYQLETVLDRGATAGVWLAYDRKLGRNVAIKIFHAEHSPAIAEILAEARAACEVVSDHVVRVHDVHDDDPAYIVMELVGEHDPHGKLQPGASAAHVRPRDFDEAARWVRDIARGVHDAHLRNVFHRDLKPHNVLLTPFSRRARIADFGLAISQRDATPEVTSGLLVETPRGPARIVGTPEYMSPEQARGLPIALDPGRPDERATLVRVDVWGLGAIACMLVTGQPPWPPGEDAWELAASGTPPVIPERTRDGRRVPARLRAIVQRALALDPAERYHSAQDLADELDAYRAHRPTSIDRRARSRAVLWTRRNPQLTISLAVAAVLGVLLLVTITAVLRLRDEHRALAADREELATEIATARQELAATEGALADRSTALRDLRRAASDAQADYQAIIAAKEKALRTADRATKVLADDLARIRSERDTAETARDMYEGFWKRSRGEADAIAKQLEDAEAERDRLRSERDRAIKERDAARIARDRAETERDAAEAERARATAIRRRLEIDLAKLAAELASAHDDV